MLSTSEASRKMRIVLVGDNASGKTSIARQLTAKSFSQEYSQTLGLDIYNNDMPIGALTFCLELWDIGGQTITSKAASNFIHAAHAIIFVYDVTHTGSLRALETWIKLVHMCKMATDTSLPLFVLAANKCDLGSSRAVKAAQHVRFARHYNLPSFEVSARTGDGIADMFWRVALDLSGTLPLTLTDEGFTVNETEKPQRMTVAGVGREGHTRLELGDTTLVVPTTASKAVKANGKAEGESRCNVM
ncbi:P-loop containing nucleoside triphosphate hydrolase protein [Chytriomyces sp. MP71]|nr:P-loop containing nucleoside triphosphate hydrolase protein [Chytriomyces sp. MP71]